MGKRAVPGAMSKTKKAAVVRLNVGGKYYDTTEQTLASADYFRSLFGNNFAITVDSKKRIFIDRCGDLFGVILNCLRDGSRPPQHVVSNQGHELCAECAYYGIDWLEHKIKGYVSPTDMRPEDRVIRDTECRIRDGSECIDILIDVFKRPMTPVNPEELQAPLLLKNKAPRPVLKGTFDDFRERLNQFTGNLLGALELDHVVIAGGAVLGALCDFPAHDVDIFLTCSPEQASSVNEQIFAAIKESSVRNNPEAPVLVTRSKACLTYFRCQQSAPPIQVVLYCSRDVQDLLTRFDIDAACFAYITKTQKVVCTPRGKRALIYGANIADNSLYESSVYIERLRKYSERGFAVSVPGFEPDKVSERITSRGKYYTVEGRELLLRVDDVNNQPPLSTFVGNRSVRFQRIEKGCAVRNFEALVALDLPGIQTIDLPVTSWSSATKCLEASHFNTLLRTKGRDEYDILWNASVDSSSDEGDSDEENEYSQTPAAAAVKLLERYLDAQELGNTLEGGVLEKLSRAMHECASKAARVADDALYARQHSPVFVYDFVQGTSAKRVAELKYIMDAAARPSPLKELCSQVFFEKYKIERSLAFHPSTAPLRSLKVSDWWSSVYI